MYILFLCNNVFLYWQITLQNTISPLIVQQRPHIVEVCTYIFYTYIQLVPYHSTIFLPMTDYICIGIYYISSTEHSRVNIYSYSYNVYMYFNTYISYNFLPVRTAIRLYRLGIYLPTYIIYIIFYRCYIWYIFHDCGGYDFLFTQAHNILLSTRLQ